jgi:hypothetical protein
MKQVVILSSDLPQTIKDFILLWKQTKGYSNPDSLDVGEVIELLIATSHNLRHEESDGRFFNNILMNEESLIAWEGEELIDILFYEVIQNIRHRLKTSKMF